MTENEQARANDVWGKHGRSRSLSDDGLRENWHALILPEATICQGCHYSIFSRHLYLTSQITLATDPGEAVLVELSVFEFTGGVLTVATTQPV